MFFFFLALTTETKLKALLSPWQVSSPLQHKQSRQSETIDIFQKEGLSSCGGGIQVAPPNHRCRPCPWPRHGQQRKWADVLRRSAGQLRAPRQLCRRLKDGRGRRQVQRLYRGASRAARLPSVVVGKKHLFFFFFFLLNLNCYLTRGVLSPSVRLGSYRGTTKLWLTSSLEEIYDWK